MTEVESPSTQAVLPQTSSPAVARAEASDAAGRHVEAVNYLASAARSKDVEALTRLGKRLLVGDRAPLLPNDGARMLAEAVTLGGAEATALLAVLYAVGGSRRHGIADALDALAVAADRGWPTAQAQLRLLAVEHTADDGGAVSSSDWRRLRNRIEVAAWREPPAAASLSTSPLVQLVPALLSAAVCQWLIDRSRGRLARAKVYDASSKRTTVSETRTNTAATFNLLDLDVVTVLVQTRLAACAGIPFRQLEPLSVLHYDAGEEITEHYDFVDPSVPDYEQEIATRGQRIVTFLVYLNDDYGGGATEFPAIGVSHKGRRGEGLLFVNALPDGGADVRTLHAGRPPTSGEKWIVSQFMRDRATL
jgi:hypothetical protein